MRPVGTLRGSSGSSLPDDGEDPPLVRQAAQDVLATRLERQPGAGHQVPDGAGRQHLARAGQRRDPLPDVDGDPADVVADQLALAGVQARPDLQPERPDRLDDRARTADRPGRPVERRQEAVAGRLDLAAPEAGQLLPHDGDRGCPAVEPAAVSKLVARSVELTMSVNRTVASTRSGSGVPLARSGTPRSRRGRVGRFANTRHMVDAGQLDELRARDRRAR